MSNSTKSKRRNTPRERAPKATGRPPVDISAETIEGMASVGASIEDVADFLEVSRATIDRRFAKLFHKHKAGKRIRLQQAQFAQAVGRRAGYDKQGVMQPAIAPNPSMQIWLGKQWLKQSDKVETPVDEQGNEIPRQRIKVGGIWVVF